ncbi:hypothetical protein OIU79_023854 [Salix purpurea]|uniref:Uncharacterized protein n=1 Tax=Salix purpurea TaxID=77065 RepID=A0A9Q0WAV2_SALPP|nr:hypothetical protein OIU79_023854 [Salix purpurea]
MTFSCFLAAEASGNTELSIMHARTGRRQKLFYSSLFSSNLVEKMKIACTEGGLTFMGQIRTSRMKKSTRRRNDPKPYSSSLMEPPLLPCFASKYWSPREGNHEEITCMSSSSKRGSSIQALHASDGPKITSPRAPTIREGTTGDGPIGL